MSSFLINPEEINIQVTGINQCADKLTLIRSRLTSIQDNLCINASQKASISGNIGSVAGRIQSEINGLTDIQTGLSSISRNYSATEGRNVGVISGEAVPSPIGEIIKWGVLPFGLAGDNPENLRLMEALNRLIGVGASCPLASQIGETKGPKITNEFNWGMLGNLGVAVGMLAVPGIGTNALGIGVAGGLINFWNENAEGKVKAKNKKKLAEHEASKIDGFGGSKIYNEKTGKWEDAPKEDKDKNRKGKLVDAKLWGVDATASTALYKNGISDENEYGSYSFNAEVLKATATASAYVGTLGLGASVGASITALHLEGEGKLGDDNLGAYVKGEVDVGKVEAKADVKLGLDKDGKFNAKVGASAEAIAGEASIKGGVNIAGADVGVKASVNYGIGVKANFGIEGGVIKADLGATLGVGASVSLEIDVSKPIQAVAGAAKSAAEYVGGAINDAGKAVGDAVSTAGKVIGDIGSGVGKAASEVGKFVGNLFKW